MNSLGLGAILGPGSHACYDRELALPGSSHLSPETGPSSGLGRCMLPKRLPSMTLAQPHFPFFWGAHGKERPACTPEAQVDTMERARELQNPECN